MGDYYCTEMADVLRAAGLRVGEGAVNAGWQTRARLSGGWASKASIFGVFWHHTASSTTPERDLAFMVNGTGNPIGNMLIDRTGKVWPIAAGASNCAGKGGPSTFSRGTIPLDVGNTRGWQIEVANNGIGEQWPVEQVDAFFAASNALNAHFGNLPTDVITHALGAGDGWTNRKIDPARATAVQGGWRPRAVNSSGTWSLADVRAECKRRATPAPLPPPVVNQEDEVTYIYAFTTYANTFSENGVALTPEAFTAMKANGAVVITSAEHEQHIDSLLHLSGLDRSALVPKK